MPLGGQATRGRTPVDDSTLEYGSDGKLNVKALGIDTGQLAAGAVTADKLGASVATFAWLAQARASGSAAEGTGSIGFANTRYMQCGPTTGTAVTDTEATAQTTLPAALTVNRLAISVATNTLDAPGAVATLRKNGADTSIIVAIDQSTGQLVATGSVSFAAGDVIGVEFTGAGTSGAMTVRNILISGAL